MQASRFLAVSTTCRGSRCSRSCYTEDCWNRWMEAWFKRTIRGMHSSCCLYWIAQNTDQGSHLAWGYLFAFLARAHHCCPSTGRRTICLAGDRKAVEPSRRPYTARWESKIIGRQLIAEATMAFTLQGQQASTSAPASMRKLY